MMRGGGGRGGRGGRQWSEGVEELLNDALRTGHTRFPDAPRPRQLQLQSRHARRQAPRALRRGAAMVAPSSPPWSGPSPGATRATTTPSPSPPRLPAPVVVVVVAVVV